jgi:hypothetical protein
MLYFGRKGSRRNFFWISNINIKVSTGAYDDLKKAYNIALTYVS